MTDNIQIILIERLNGCKFYRPALDDWTDVSGTHQLSIFIRRVSRQFIIVEDLLDLCPMKSTAKGRHTR